MVEPERTRLAHGRCLAHVAVAFVICPFAVGASAAAEPIAEVRVARVIDGDTLALVDGGELRLAGILAPKSAPGRGQGEIRALARAAEEALGRLAEGRRLRLDYTGTPRDRHGRWIAQATVESGSWLNGEMVRAGHAIVATQPDNRGRAAELLGLESAARAASRGVWAHPSFRVLADTETPKFIDRFRLVEGRVVAAGLVKGRAYLNFGADWRTDFTVVIARETMALFRKAGLAPEAYSGRRIRVRGWIAVWNGPMIEATHPEQIEVIEE